MKKIFILFLSVVLVLSSFSSVFASEGTLPKMSEGQEMFSIFNQMDADVSSITEKNGAEYFSIQLKDSDIKTNVKKVLKENGDVVFNFQEGNKSNELTLTKEKDLLLDGNPVMITDEYNGRLNTYPLNLSIEET